MAIDFKDSLNLPSTEFSMKANLPQKEPQFIDNWEKMDLYGEMLKKNEGKPSFILHDGPPFSNNNIHMGTALNKIFKDFNNHQLKMVTWDMDTINSILKEIGFSVVLTRSDDKGHYPVLLAKKV